MDELDTLVVRVRADTQGLSRDVDQMRAMLEGPLAQGAQAAGHAMDRAMRTMLQNGKLGWEDMKRLALSALDEIARAQMASLTGGKGFGGMLVAMLQGFVGSGKGAPGRATGGLVSPGRTYMVGERGPELFVPTSSGQIANSVSAPARTIAITVNVQGGEKMDGDVLRRSGRQTAMAIARALERSRW